jgi:hypothetical protein
MRGGWQPRCPILYHLLQHRSSKCVGYVKTTFWWHKQPLSMSQAPLRWSHWHSNMTITCLGPSLMHVPSRDSCDVPSMRVSCNAMEHLCRLYLVVSSGASKVSGDGKRLEWQLRFQRQGWTSYLLTSDGQLQGLSPQDDSGLQINIYTYYKAKPH